MRHHPDISSLNKLYVLVCVSMFMIFISCSTAYLSNNIQKALKDGDIAKIQESLEQGENPNSKDIEGNAALFLCPFEEHNSLDIIRLLLKHGADIDTRDDAGNTPMMFVLLTSNPSREPVEIVQLFLDFGSKPNTQNKLGVSPLMMAALGNKREIAKLLLKFGANVNLQTDGGKTALILASMVGGKEVAELLISAGANLLVKDKENMTAIDYAQKEGHEDIVQMLNKAIKNKR